MSHKHHACVHVIPSSHRDHCALFILSFAQRDAAREWDGVQPLPCRYTSDLTVVPPTADSNNPLDGRNAKNLRAALLDVDYSYDKYADTPSLQAGLAIVR